MAKSSLPLIRPLLPYLPLLPTPVLTLPAALALHFTTHPSPTFHTFLQSPTTHPIHIPLLLTLGLMTVLYPLGVVSGNVSWVDRIWTTYPVLCSGLVVLWGRFNETGAAYGHNLPRLGVMLLLQVIWSARLTYHTLRRGLYDLTSEDYRYTAMRKIVPGWFFQLVHFFAVALAQPLLLFALSLPLQSLLLLPPSELSRGPLAFLSLNYSSITPLLPARFATAAPDTPVLNIYDLLLFISGLTLIAIEQAADNQMYDFQTAKHAIMETESKSKSAPQKKSTKSNLPQPVTYPEAFHPGFPTKGLFSISRHANYACEQLFWFNQALFVVVASRSASDVSKSGWVGGGLGGILGPALALSLLFCGSTTLTEWITTRKYPLYKQYSQLVGQFLPNETAIKYLWTTIRGTRAGLTQQLHSKTQHKNTNQ
ncbi:hypothetical protein P7C73_g756, partial [Tremellales sp. Uapishka_1]